MKINIIEIYSEMNIFTISHKFRNQDHIEIIQFTVDVEYECCALQTHKKAHILYSHFNVYFNNIYCHINHCKWYSLYLSHLTMAYRFGRKCLFTKFFKLFSLLQINFYTNLFQIWIYIHLPNWNNSTYLSTVFFPKNDRDAFESSSLLCWQHQVAKIL